MDAKFLALHRAPKQGRTLIVGSRVYSGREDRRLKHQDAFGIDLLPGEGVDRALDLEETLPTDMGHFDHVECVSVLEHAKRPWLLAANIERLMTLGATIWLSVPFVWRVHAYPSDYWRFSADGVRLLFPSIAWDALNYSGAMLRNEVDKIVSKNIDGWQHFERTQVLGFGEKT